MALPRATAAAPFPSRLEGRGPRAAARNPCREEALALARDDQQVQGPQLMLKFIGGTIGIIFIIGLLVVIGILALIF